MAARNTVLRSINDIPDDRLSDIPDNNGSNPLHSTDDLRLDMQGMTSDSPQRHNLQIQISGHQLNTSIAVVLAPSGASPEAIKQGFRDSFDQAVITRL
ncbi:hypothetical protein BGW38_007704, partial [Lunasporangiospora selenospora]